MIILLSSSIQADEMPVEMVLSAEATNLLDGVNAKPLVDFNNVVIVNKQADPVVDESYIKYSQEIQSENKPNYFVDAGKYYAVSPWLLWAVGKVESNHNPYAINKNKNGTYDIGIMQINSIHLKRLAKYGISKNDLFVPKINIYVGAFLLKECINKYGQNWNAVSCYNGMSAENKKYFVYAKKVHKALNNGVYLARNERGQ